MRTFWDQFLASSYKLIGYDFRLLDSSVDSFNSYDCIRVISDKFRHADKNRLLKTINGLIPTASVGNMMQISQMTFLGLILENSKYGILAGSMLLRIGQLWSMEKSDPDVQKEYFKLDRLDLVENNIQ